MTEYTAQLSSLRATVNEYELTFNEKKKRFKYEIQLDQEKQMLDYIDNENENLNDQSAFGINSINQINENEIAMSEFLQKGRDTEVRSQKGGWLSKENYYRKSSIGVNKMMTEEDLTKLTDAQLRKNKEQLMTDILCGIPDSL